MRTIAYGAFLLLLLAASVVLLRSIEPVHEGAGPFPRVTGSLEPVVSAIDLDRLEGAGATELYDLAAEFMQVWRPREATMLLERAVAADSTFYPAWLKLVECYAHPLVGDESALEKAVVRAGTTAPAPADTALVAGLRQLYVDRDYAGAVGALSAVVRAEAATIDARYHLALAYYQMGRLRDASRYLEPLLSEDPTVAPVVELYIRRAVAARELERAADAARELARMYAEEPFPYVLSAQVELARGNREAAVEFCDNALDLDPACAPAIMTRACLYAEAGDFQSARVSFEKLLLFDAAALQSIGHEGVAFVDFLAGDFDHGVASMDEATRHAMFAGATRRGLSLAYGHVEYLCQLGQPDAAQGVIERWLTGFGEIPVQMASARVALARGDTRRAAETVARLSAEKEWILWARKLSLDATDLAARVEIGEERQREAAVRLQEDAKSATAVAAGAFERRTFLAGYAAFESGDAESAAAAFSDVHRRLYGVEFPYHGDPVVYVQALFFLAETDLARGNQVAARASYEAFLGYWGDASWKLEAVDRARRKLEALGEATASPQG
ncbi:MAG TPA: tetratricopeptide repeat protein [Candidatus Krumholzibacteria bacterium]|nr:tetratricopeptide repeat protein [Candidatus Krumholzibacteria bacterium]